MFIVCTRVGELEIIMLNEINQSQTNVIYFPSDVESILKAQNTRKWKGDQRKQIRGNREGTKGNWRMNR